MSLATVLNENKTYWTHRAPSYSEVNRRELHTDSRRLWRNELLSALRERFPGRPTDTLEVLEVGTGPGFFAILLAEAGVHVTAVDLTPSMLAEARRNAGALAKRVRWMEMNAEELSFPAGSFDAVISRNLTWNLPHPEKAYSEWLRVLRPGGMVLNFDANWYHYLCHAEALDAYREDRRRTAERGYEDANVGEHFDVMEDIARKIPLTGVARPAWDEKTLAALGARVTCDTETWRRVWSEEEKVNFSSTPMFSVRACVD